ncbi:hypothetical protein JCM17846_32650 [Iodidimonas nitroreducens]|uniref:Uncharacterized protein n=1 Tax=Iodidimonas nitroreducens TaxID=1236968 RepID=A0A5A7NB06_9PROT|nr:hypothetical protein JCM17846_32650 [Iodidimonas nitroreducens]
MAKPFSMPRKQYGSSGGGAIRRGLPYDERRPAILPERVPFTYPTYLMGRKVNPEYKYAPGIGLHRAPFG